MSMVLDDKKFYSNNIPKFPIETGGKILLAHALPDPKSVSKPQTVGIMFFILIIIVGLKLNRFSNLIEDKCVLLNFFMKMNQ